MRGSSLFFYQEARLLLEITIVKSLKAFSVSCFVSCHFVNCVMNCIKVCCFCILCNSYLVGTSSCFCVRTFLEISLCSPNYFSQKFCKLSSMFCFFPSVTLECFSNFRIAFSVCLTAHSQIHSHLGAFAHKVCV